VVVASEGDELLGTANMYANRPGPGAHIASGNFMVKQTARGSGVGRALGNYRMYKSLGFSIIGTVPKAFEHPIVGRVGLHVMFHDLHRVEADTPAGAA
jgi:hypothetical protein